MTRLDNLPLIDPINVPDSLPEDIQAVLTNAIYFKDAWTIPFDEYEGEPSFSLMDGKTIGAQDGLKMMSRTSYEFGRTKFTMDGLKDVEFQAVTIPYKVSTWMGDQPRQP